VVSDQKTRDVRRALLDAGFAPQRSDGSHTWWRHASGVGVAVPDGHPTISPGVWAKILKVIRETEGTQS